MINRYICTARHVASTLTCACIPAFFARFGVILLRAAILTFGALPLAAQCQTPLLPRLATIPVPAPSNLAFFAVVSMAAKQAAIAFYSEQLRVDGNSITAYFDSGCGFLCPGPPSYASFPLRLPALLPGTYQLTIVDAGNPSYVWATFPLMVGAGRTPELITHPSPPPANQPFDAELLILAHPDDFGIYYGPDIQGSQISFLFDDYYCTSTCSNELSYRSFPLHFPALAQGTYEVQFVAGNIRQFVFGTPALPPAAHFSLNVGTATNPVPTAGFPALLFGALGLVTLALRALRWRLSRSGE